MNIILKTINQAVTFLLEIAMLVAYGYYGMSLPWTFFPRLLFAIFLVAVVIVLWGIFAAPKSARRLKMPFLTIFRTSVFLISAFLLFQAGQKNMAILLVGLTIVTQTTGYYMEK
ncbi:YrdB family protein [Chitinophagaceae bacterium 26-R-25]|nr:YrdB family protein [Chitinophagaceae bacterium 26-R-25]